MSADRIGERCPGCEAFALREYYDIKLGKSETHITLAIKYAADCRNCAFAVTADYAPAPLKALSTNTTNSPA